jgi:hypothetical protein
VIKERKNSSKGPVLMRRSGKEGGKNTEVIKEQKNRGEGLVLMYRSWKEGKWMIVGRRNRGVEKVYLRR